MKYIFTFLSAIICFCFFNYANAQVNVADSLALVDLYNSTNGPQWSLHENWLTSAPVSAWYGVTVANNRVTKLRLPSNQLNGTLPSTMGNLTALTNLLITSSNSLKGPIPNTFGNLANLAFLSFYDNGLTGAIPSSLGNDVNLKIINLSYNAFSGSVPASFSNISGLKQLSVISSNLSGSIPSSLAGLDSLTNLNLRGNTLSGAADFLGSLKSLINFDLTDNNFSGNLPHFSKTSTVIYVYLDRNNFSGSLTNIGEPLKMVVFSASDNNISGGLPGAISNAKNLAYINLYKNKISGSIPASIGKCTRLTNIYFNENNLNGSVPSEIGNLKALNSLALGGNQLSGALPSSLAGVDALTDLTVENNRFTFAGIEDLVDSFSYFRYAPQAKIPVHLTGNTLSVSAGGTLSNNTYKWYKNDELIATKKGDSTLIVNSSGTYKVLVKNSIATELTLKSDTLNYAAENNKIIADTKPVTITLSPNPAKDILRISGLPDNKKSIINIINRNGNVLASAISYSSSFNLNVSALHSGMYHLSVDVNGTIQTIKFVKE